MKGKKRPWLWALALAALALVVLGVYLAVGRRPAAYTPYPRDAGATAYAGWAEQPPLLRSEQYALGLNPEARVEADGGCALGFINPQGNDVYLMLDIRLEDSGLLVWRTGLIAPGEGLEQVTLPPEALSAMKPGAQGALFTIYSFDVDGYLSRGEIQLAAQLTLVEENV